MQEHIDIIIPWVDGTDKEWQRLKNLYNNSTGDNREIRDTLQMGEKDI